MKNATLPREYSDWRSGEFARAEDAAHNFGYYLVRHCRDEALATVPPGAATDLKATVEETVDVALHNVCDMLEGFWRLDCGPTHTVSLALCVQVRDAANNVVETIEISPSKLDLPIGYWTWARDREFR